MCVVSGDLVLVADQGSDDVNLEIARMTIQAAKDLGFC
jgi:hypothetical protein